MFDLIIIYSSTGQFLRLIVFAFLLFLTARELFHGKNSITAGLLLISLGSVINAFASLFGIWFVTLTSQTDLLELGYRFIIGSGAWLAGLGAGQIIIILIKQRIKTRKGNS